MASESCDSNASCGISNCFQLVFPTPRQVPHALLTRPPLNYISVTFNIVPFDLHVLSTPPAFILSQDQTLNKMILKRSRATIVLLKLSFLIFKLEINEIPFTALSPVLEGFSFLLVLCSSLFNLQGANPLALGLSRAGEMGF